MIPIRKNLKIQDMVRLRYFNKKLNLNYILKLKSKKIGTKPRPIRHRKMIRHNNEIAFTQQNNSIVLKQIKRQKNRRRQH